MRSMLQNKKTWSYFKKIAGTACFFVILAYVFIHVTYLFRGDIANRENVVGIKEEEPLDVVYIGGSAAYCYWEPLKWGDCGFTSYDLATSGIEAESILYYMKLALKYHSPKLFVVGVRAFEYYSGEGTETGVRRTSDALDFLDMDRYRFIETYLNNRTLDIDKWPLYLDIAKYHTNYEALASPESWALLHNSTQSLSKGSHIQTYFYYMEEPQEFRTMERAELKENASATLLELLDFCKEEDLEVLFVVSPYSITERDYAIYNTIEDIVSEYGYRFLNTNDHYAEMDFKFAEDFSDGSHVNSLGAEKYTAFLENYLLENYQLPDHREESRYAKWNELYAQYAAESSAGRADVRSMIELAQQGKAAADELYGSIDDTAAWCDLARDPRFTVIAVGEGESLSAVSYKDIKALESLGLQGLNTDNYIRVLCGQEVLYSNADTGESSCEIDIGPASNRDSSCIIDNTLQGASVLIHHEECSRKDKEGINIVVYENDYRYMIDSFTIKADADGNLLFLRQ